jgi:hypothetical protein
MADVQSRFKRPTQPAASVVSNPDAEQFVRGPSAVEPPRVEEPQVTAREPEEVAHRVQEEKPKKVKEKRLTIDIPESLHKRVKAGCVDQGTTIADVVRAFLEKKFPEPRGS